MSDAGVVGVVEGAVLEDGVGLAEGVVEGVRTDATSTLGLGATPRPVSSAVPGVGGYFEVGGAEGVELELGCVAGVGDIAGGVGAIIRCGESVRIE